MTHAGFLTAHQLARHTGGVWHHTPPLEFAAVDIDNRLLGDGGLFVALPGAQADGHEFVSRLNPEAGQAAIVSDAQACNVAQLVTDNPLTALQQIASYCASQTTATKLAVTGSVGKTGTKEMIAHMLAAHGHTHASSGNYNNHIGLPLTLANMPSACRFIVTEMGMNHPGELTQLSAIARPHIAAITCIADSHMGHFSSLEDIAAAKAEIFSSLSEQAIAILPVDDAFYPQLRKTAEQAGAKQIITFGSAEGADFQLLDTQPDAKGQSVQMRSSAQFGGKTHQFTLGMQAPHWAMNAMCACAVVVAAGIPLEKATPSLKQLQDVKGRGRAAQITIAQRTITLIDDSYNASPQSVKAALSALRQRQHQAPPCVILSDMLELGDFEDEAHLQLEEPLCEAGTDTFIAIGPMMSRLGARMSSRMNVICFENAEHLLQHPQHIEKLFDNLSAVTLIKGSHGSGAHKIAQLLMQQSDAGGVDAS